MRSIRVVALAGVVLAAAAVIASAGAAPRRAEATKIDLSSTAAIAKYLRSIGVDPATVVVQRGKRNYAGPRCPGKRWNCTKARRVLQLSTRGTWNQFECSESTGPTVTHTTTPDSCFVMQSSESSNNLAVCRERSDAPDVTQSCTIIQQSTSGVNRARVRQIVEQDVEQTASATQTADVTQHNGSGKNLLRIVQKVGQNAEGFDYAAAQDVQSDQKFTITQDADTGAQRARIRQSADQDAEVEDVTGGTQREEASLVGDVVHQTSAGKSTIDVRQNERQEADAPPDSGVQQTLIGPVDCCTDQSGSPSDTFKISQKSVQRSSSDSAALSEDMSIFCSSSGSCEGTQQANENGAVTTNSCEAFGTFCRAELTCAEGVCTTSSCTGEGCDTSEPPEGPVAAFSFDEGEGSTAGDSSGHGNSGSTESTTWSQDGKHGGALSFNGWSSDVTVPDAPSLHLTDAMTLEAWVYPTELGTAWRTVLFKEQQNGMAYSLYANQDTSLPVGQVNVEGEQNALGSGTLPLNAWTHLAATYDGQTLRLYVNGAPAGSKQVSGPIAASESCPLRIGGNSIWGERFAGLIDDVRVYDRALSQAQIETDMATAVA
jgi:hypothetical protein